MADYYIVDSNSSLSDGDTIDIDGVTYTVIQIDDGVFGSRTDAVVSSGDNVLVSGDLTGTVTIAPDGSTAEESPLNVTLQDTTGTQTIAFSDPLFGGSFSPTVTVPDGVDASSATIDGGGTDGITVDIGDNASIADIYGSGDDDTITTGVGSTAGDIYIYGGNDQVTVNGTVGTIDTGGGGDTVVLGDGAVSTGSIDLGGGNDKLTAGTGTTINNIWGGDGQDSITLGESATVTGNIATGTDLALDDADYLEIGANSTVAGYINTNTGDDTVIIGDNSVLNGGSTAINTYIGDDTVILGEGVIATNKIFTGQGSDTVQAGTGSFTVDQGILTPNDDTITIKYGFGNEQAFLDALAAQGFTDPDGDGTYFGGSNSTFTYGGITYTDADFINGIACFTLGTMIRTDRGLVAIEDLYQDDMVWTRDHGYQALRWIGQRHLSAQTLESQPNLRPIRIKSGALAPGLPSQDLLVSPQHRVLVRSQIAERMFGQSEVLVATKHLCAIDGIDVAEDQLSVTYFHMLFERHEIVESNGAETESLYVGKEAMKSLSPEMRDEIFAIFPELANHNETPEGARVFLAGKPARKLAERHQKNAKSLLIS